MPLVAPSCLRVAFIVLAQLSLQLCGELIQLKITLHKNAVQLPQNVKPQPWGFAGGGGWVVMEAFGCWEHSEFSQDSWCEPLHCLLLDSLGQLDFLPNYCALVLKETYVPLIVGIYFSFHVLFP